MSENPFAPPQTRFTGDGNLPSQPKRPTLVGSFLRGFGLSLLIALVAHALCQVVGPTLDEIPFGSAVALIWVILLVSAFRTPHLLPVVAFATGLVWAFLGGITISRAIEYGDPSGGVIWSKMLPGLVIMPLMAVATVLPGWLLGLWWRKPNRR